LVPKKPQYNSVNAPLQAVALYKARKGVLKPPAFSKFILILPLAGTLTLNHTSLILVAVITPQDGLGIAGVNVAPVQEKLLYGTQP
jgi:hypothetical protein